MAARSVCARKRARRWPQRLFPRNNVLADGRKVRVRQTADLAAIGDG
jgi:hypothetical protein